MSRKKRTFDALNFPPSAQEKFDALMTDDSWTWSGLARALIRLNSPSDTEDFRYCLVEEMVEAQR